MMSRRQGSLWPDVLRDRRHLAGATLALMLLTGVAALMSPTGSARAADEPGSAQTQPRVVVLPTRGVVDQVMATYLREGIDRAARDGAAAVVIALDTPGGSLDSTREIVQAELAAEVPVIVWVGPPGARAASAGTFVTMAAHVAAMAPATNIGAATPISSDGQDIGGDLGQKVLNDTVANMTAIAQERGRPVDWAVGTITEARSYTSDEALTAGAIDLQADTVAELVQKIDGMSIEVAGAPVILDTAGAEVVELGMNPFQSLLHLLSDPNVAFILFTIGFYGLFFELQNPNFVTGILGAFAIILAFIGFGSLPLNIAGLLLIGLAIVLFVLELTVTSSGLLTVGGLVAFVLGASALYTEPGDPVGPAVHVAGDVIVSMTLATGLVMVGILIVVIRQRRRPQTVIGVSHISDPLLPVGTEATVRRPLDPTGTVYAAGEEWTARGPLDALVVRGTSVHVTGNDGMVLLVEPSGAPT